MDTSFFAYLQRIDMMAFFSGYPLIYCIVFFIAGNRQLKNNLTIKLIPFLPTAYTLVGTLYLGLQLKDLYPDYSIDHIKLTVHQPYLKIWALLSIVFWLPSFAKKTVFSLLHSFVFFFF